MSDPQEIIQAIPIEMDRIDVLNRFLKVIDINHIDILDKNGNIIQNWPAEYNVLTDDPNQKSLAVNLFDEERIKIYLSWNNDISDEKYGEANRFTQDDVTIERFHMLEIVDNQSYLYESNQNINRILKLAVDLHTHLQCIKTLSTNFGGDVGDLEEEFIEEFRGDDLFRPDNWFIIANPKYYGGFDEFMSKLEYVHKKYGGWLEDPHEDGYGKERKQYGLYTCELKENSIFLLLNAFNYDFESTEEVIEEVKRLLSPCVKREL